MHCCGVDVIQRCPLGRLDPIDLCITAQTNRGHKDLHLPHVLGSLASLINKGQDTTAVLYLEVPIFNPLFLNLSILPCQPVTQIT